MDKLAFGELEFSILKIVRKSGRVTVRDVYETLGSKGSYTTIMTVMSRMAEKGELTREKDGKQYIYWVPESPNLSSNSFLKRLKNKIFGEKPVEMVSYLLQSEETFTEEDLKEIEALIKKRRSEK